MDKNGDLDTAYMLDTNIFNGILDGKISVESFEGHHLNVIGVQAGELRATKNEERNSNLLTIFHEIDSTLLFASSFALDIEGAGLDQAYFNDNSGTFEKMLAKLKELDSNKKTREITN